MAGAPHHELSRERLQQHIFLLLQQRVDSCILKLECSAFLCCEFRWFVFKTGQVLCHIECATTYRIIAGWRQNTTALLYDLYGSNAGLFSGRWILRVCVRWLGMLRTWQSRDSLKTLELFAMFFSAKPAVVLLFLAP